MQMGNTSTSRSKASLDDALANVPAKFRPKVVKTFLDVKKNMAEGKDESAGLAAGKFCEVVLRLLQNEILGSFMPFNQSIGNFADECRKLITSPNNKVAESLRVVMPRGLVFIYTLRNKRGVGHIGGDVDANRIDSMTSGRVCDWIICELIRVYHKLSLEEAQDVVDSLAQRNIPDIWSVGGKKRILRKGLRFKDQVLLICYSDPDNSIFAEDIFSWVEYSDLAVFKSKVLAPLHKERLIEYDRESELVTISPLGIKDVEERILKAAVSPTK